MATDKDTIYVDTEEEITAIIDKVKSSPSKVVALVLPKRAAMLQSIVNLKLLKRSADNEKKTLVLITTEAGLLPLAGAVGLHVASSLTDSPEVPSPPSMGSNRPETVDEDMTIPMGEETETPDLTEHASKASAVGALAEAAKHHASKADQELETLELDNRGPETATNPTSKESAKKSKHLKVPNFNRFRAVLIIGVVLVAALVLLGILAFAVWPHADISIQTNAANVNVNLPLTLDTTAQSANFSNGDLPAKAVTEQKTFTATVPTTGHQNLGNTATGTVVMLVPCSAYPTVPPPDVLSGTTLTQGQYNYSTTDDTTFSSPPLLTTYKGRCYWEGTDASTGSNNIPITAQSPGSAYNTNGQTSFAVANNTSVQAEGSAAGGTDNIVPVVAQADITTATAKINTNNSSAAQQSLASQLVGDGYYPINATFTSSSPQIATSPNVGDQATSVTVTETITYTMYGAKQSDLKSAVATFVHSQTSRNQNIISYGIHQNDFKQINTNANTDQITLSTITEVGPNISLKQIRKSIAGKSPAEAVALIKQNPDVTSVSIRLSPFWVSSIPSNQSKIAINIAKLGK
jgi:hypothetical protein